MWKLEGWRVDMKYRNLLMALVIATLGACGGESQQVEIPAQHWKDMDVRIETHPSPPIAGMTEIVVIATGPHGRPAGDLIVSLRASNDGTWTQTIQDGKIGVYRRAIDMGDAGNMNLQVLLQQGQQEKIIYFPLSLAAP